VYHRVFGVGEFKYAKISKISRSQGSYHGNQIWAKKAKIADFTSAQEIEDFFCTNSKVFGVGEFKYAIQNFKGAKGVAMATKFRQK